MIERLGAAAIRQQGLGPSPSCTIIIVNWNAGDVLRDCLTSIAQQDYSPTPSVIVWDNDSSDDSLGVLACFPSIHVVPSPANVGFAKANNAASRLASSDVLIFLNPDTVMGSRSCLSTLVSEMADPEVGIVGPMLLNEDGTIQKSVGAFPSIGSSLLTGMGVHRLLSDRLLAKWTPTEWSQAWSRDVDWLKGAAMVLRARDFLQLGGFSEATFMYGEDIDLAYRVHAHGQKVRYCTDAQITHIDDHSSRKRWTDGEKEALVVKGDLAFLRAHYAWGRRTVIRVVRVVLIAVRIPLLTMIGRRSRAAVYKAMLRRLLAT